MRTWQNPCLLANTHVYILKYSIIALKELQTVDFKGVHSMYKEQIENPSYFGSDNYLKQQNYHIRMISSQTHMRERGVGANKNLL